MCFTNAEELCSIHAGFSSFSVSGNDRFRCVRKQALLSRDSFSSFWFWALSWTSDSSATPKGIEFCLWNFNFLDALYAVSEVWISSPWMQSTLHSHLVVLYAACHHIVIRCLSYSQEMSCCRTLSLMPRSIMVSSGRLRARWEPSCIFGFSYP